MKQVRLEAAALTMCAYNMARTEGTREGGGQGAMPPNNGFKKLKIA